MPTFEEFRKSLHKVKRKGKLKTLGDTIVLINVSEEAVRIENTLLQSGQQKEFSKFVLTLGYVRQLIGDLKISAIIDK